MLFSEAVASIPKAQWRRRFRAALALRGIEAKDFPVVLSGLPKNAAQRAAHFSDDYEATDTLAWVVSQELGLPQAFFTEPDLDTLLATRRSEGLDAAETVGDAELAEALAGLAEVQQQLQHVQGLLTHGGQPEGGAGSA